MYWYLIFVVIIFLLVFPIRTKTFVDFDILKLKGRMYVKIFFIKIVTVKIKIKKGYIYLYKGKKVYKEQLSMSNPDIKKAGNILQSLYYRIELECLTLKSEFGYVNDAMKTALITSGFDIIIKCFLAKVKNNKKLAHILVENKPNYDYDKMYLTLSVKVRTCVADVLYALVMGAGGQR